MESAIILILFGALYLLPSILVSFKSHPQGAAVCALNLLLGWTLLGWVGALCWALALETRGN